MPELEQLYCLVRSLADEADFGHSKTDIQLIETHISLVLLVGEFAYKFKKPVDLGFLDFSSLERREHFCREELRINRRSAPELYLGLVSITGSPQRPVIGGSGPVIEYAVKMRRFPAGCLAADLAETGHLHGADVDAMADAVAGLHENAAIVSSLDPAGRPGGPAFDNFVTLCDAAAACPRAPWAKALGRLESWTRSEVKRLAPTFSSRAGAGAVREGHGDLHLRNIVCAAGVVRLFDAIEFDASLRNVDVLNDAAFLIMDLHYRKLPGLANRFLNRYLELRGDYEGLLLLRYFLVYRALVRAKVALLSGQRESLRRHVELADSLCSPGPAPVLWLMHGFSGSGKSVFSGRLLESLPAIRVRSDVERKRLFGLRRAESSQSGLNEGLYSTAANDAVNDRLATLAGDLLGCGYPVIVDATFLKQAARQRFIDLGRSMGHSVFILDTVASEDTLRQRILERETEVSEANLAVLAQQIAECDPLTPEEAGFSVRVDTEREGEVRTALATIEKLSTRSGPC